jgi:hypothetical protein
MNCAATETAFLKKPAFSSREAAVMGTYEYIDFQKSEFTNQNSVVKICLTGRVHVWFPPVGNTA